MATIASPVEQKPLGMSARYQTRPVTTNKIDYLMVLLSVWFTGGLFLDGWAHTHNQVESFFTPWHAVLYSGFLVNAAAIAGVWYRNIRQGYATWKAIPAGYEMSVVGAVIFAVGGVLDLLWHTLFGIEVNLEALISPSHLFLALGLILIVNGPFRAAWQRTNPPARTIFSYAPMLLSLGFTLCILTFFTFPLHPFIYQYANARVYNAATNPELYVTVGLATILLQTAILMGIILVAMRRWRLPFGALTAVLTLNALLLSVFSLKLTFVPVAFIAGLVGDTLIAILKPSPLNPVRLRIFAFVVPVVLYLGYFAALALNGGVGWSLPFWGGSVTLAGVVGLLLSYVLVPSPALVVSPAQYDS